MNMKPRFDYTLNLGHLLTALALCGTLLASGLQVVRTIDRLEAQMENVGKQLAATQNSVEAVETQTSLEFGQIRSRTRSLEIEAGRFGSALAAFRDSIAALDAGQNRILDILERRAENGR